MRAPAASRWTEQNGYSSLYRTNAEHNMPGNPREMITMAERNFPVRIRLAFHLTVWGDAMAK